MLTRVSRIQYLTINSIEEGVGASQVLSYLRCLSDTHNIRLVTFEKIEPKEETRKKVAGYGIDWIPLNYGKQGLIGAIGRVFRMISNVQILPTHARGELPFLCAFLAGCREILWDCRALSADQRLSVQGTLRASIEYWPLRLLERLCARKSSFIVVITNSIIPIITSRHNIDTGKFTVISTCVDLMKFKPMNSKSQDSRLLPEINSSQKTIRILLSGTYGPHYDLELTSNLIQAIRLERKVLVTVALGLGHEFPTSALKIDEILNLTPYEKMPGLISNFDVGISIWRHDLGVCLASVAATKNAEFLACGKPIVVNFNQGDIGNQVKSFRAGVVTDGSSGANLDLVVSELLSLLDDFDFANRCRRLAVEHYSLQEGTTKLSKMYFDMSHTTLY